MKSTKPFALCLDNTRYEASLIVGKVYRVLPDKKAAKDDLVRIVDESGEDYLFHKDHFFFLDFPRTVKRRILAVGLGRPLWVTGYANDVMAYIPSERVLKEGGYEGDTSRAA